MASELETVSGTIVPPAATGKQLDARQLQAAALEAAGLSRKDIADAVGVSTASIRVWRTKEEYRAEIERLKQAGTTQLQPLITELTVEMIQGATDAVQALKEQLHATNKDGDPLHTTRQEAARILLQYGVKVIEPTITAKDAQPTGPTQAIQVNIDMSKPPAPPDV